MEEYLVPHALKSHDKVMKINLKTESLVARKETRYASRNAETSSIGRDWMGRIILVISSRSADEYSGSLDHTRWSARIHAHRCIHTRESRSRIWRETAFDRSSIVLSICRLLKTPWYSHKSTFLSPGASFCLLITRSRKYNVRSSLGSWYPPLLP